MWQQSHAVHQTGEERDSQGALRAEAGAGQGLGGRRDQAPRLRLAAGGAGGGRLGASRGHVARRVFLGMARHRGRALQELWDGRPRLGTCDAADRLIVSIEEIDEISKLNKRCSGD